jgi:hypothetical protein
MQKKSLIIIFTNGSVSWSSKKMQTFPKKWPIWQLSSSPFVTIMISEFSNSQVILNWKPSEFLRYVSYELLRIMGTFTHENGCWTSVFLNLLSMNIVRVNFPAFLSTPHFYFCSQHDGLLMDIWRYTSTEKIFKNKRKIQIKYK